MSETIVKLINATLTVTYGVAGAFIAFWLLNTTAELLPSKVGNKIKPYLYILPAYLSIVVYLIMPTIQTLISSFRDRYSHDWVGLTNYSELLSDEKFRDALFNTALWIVIVPIATVVLGLVVAVLADRLSDTGEKVVKTLIFMPMAVSMVGASTIWGFIYETRPDGRPQVGVLNGVVAAAGSTPVAWLQQSQFQINDLLLMVVLLWAQIGFSMVLLSAAIKAVPTETLEAARIDGATERQVFFKVVLPQVKATVITVFITITIMVIKLFDIVYVMTNGAFQTSVIGNEFYRQYSTNYHNGKASAIVIMLMIAVIPIMAYQVKHFRDEEVNA